MQFIITNGTAYCNRSNRQAVTIVDTKEAATKFADREAAEKLLARATKKLKGFYIEPLSDAERSPETGTARKEKTAKQNAGRRNAAKPKQDAPEEKPAAKQNAGRRNAAKPKQETAEEKPVEKQPDEKPEETAAGEAKENQGTGSSGRSRSRRGGRRRSSSAASAAKEEAPAAKEAAPAEKEKAPAEKEEAPAKKEEAPGKKKEAPAKKEEAPAKKKEAPVVKETAPAAKEEAPAAKETTPVKPNRGRRPISELDISEASARLWADDIEPVKPSNKPVKAKTAVSESRKLETDVASVMAASARLWDDEAATPAAPVSVPARAPEKASHETREEKPAGETEESASAQTASSGQTSSGQTASPEQASSSGQTSSGNHSRSRGGRRSSDHGSSHADQGSNHADQGGSRAPQENLSREQADHSREQSTSGSEGSRTRRSRRRSSGSSSRSRSQNQNNESSTQTTRRRFFTQQERNLIYNRTEGHCGICGRFIPLEEYTIDHIIPLSKGGTNDLDNLQACCGFCNKAKDDSMGEEFFDRIERIFLYQAKLKYGKKNYKKIKKAVKELED